MSNFSSSVRSPWVAPRGARPVFCLFLFAPTAGFIVFTVFTVFALVVVVVPFAFARRVFAESSFVSSSFGFDSDDDSDDDIIVVLAVDAARFAPTLVSAAFAFAFAFRFFGNLFVAAAPRPSTERATASSIFRSIPASVLEIFSSMISSASSTTRSRFATASASDVVMVDYRDCRDVDALDATRARIRAFKRTRSLARVPSSIPRARADERRLHRTPRTRNVDILIHSPGTPRRDRARDLARRASDLRRPRAMKTMRSTDALHPND
jgi:hypothetical protein